MATSFEMYSTLRSKGFKEAHEFGSDRPTVVFHTSQRPGAGSVSPINEEIATRGYTIGQPHPSQSTGVDAPDGGDIDSSPRRWLPEEGRWSK
jgi:hypothetical protein